MGTKVTPYLPPRTLDVRPCSIGVVHSFGGSFAWMLWLAHQLLSVVAAKPLADSIGLKRHSTAPQAVAKPIDFTNA